MSVRPLHLVPLPIIHTPPRISLATQYSTMTMANGIHQNKTQQTSHPSSTFTMLVMIMFVYPHQWHCRLGTATPRLAFCSCSCSCSTSTFSESRDGLYKGSFAPETMVRFLPSPTTTRDTRHDASTSTASVLGGDMLCSSRKPRH